MALKNKSEINTIQGPEFINLQPLDLNPLMSECVIKVFYLGHNRNGSYIDKETALNMSKTLRGAPIVGAWNDNKEDFGDHGKVIHIEDNEVTFSCKTVPYGFVAPNAEVWFQNFTDTDEFGNQVERTYLMTNGYLWNGQYPELDKVLAEGQPHSMELDDKTLEGHWAKDNNLDLEFFIINDAVFSKLCILGDNVEPCFEGSSVTSPRGSQYSYNEFQQTLYTMMNELTEALQSKGGLNMDPEKTVVEETTTEKLEDTTFVAVKEEVISEEVIAEEVVEYTDADADEAETVEFQKDDDKDDSFEEDSDSKDDDEDEKEDDEEDEDKPSNSHSLEEYNKLQEEVESLHAEIKQLREFKLSVENEQKDALINSYPYNTLSSKDTAEIVSHKAEYSLDELKAKLAILYVEKGISFETQTSESEVEESITTFSLDSEGTGTGFVSDLQEALHKTLE